MELTLDNIIGIIGLILSAVTLWVMVTGFKVLKKDMVKIPNLTLFGEEAVAMSNSIQDRLPQAVQMSDTLYRGGYKRTPQFTIENGFSAEVISGEEIKGASKVARYYYKNANDEIMVKSWRVM